MSWPSGVPGRHRVAVTGAATLCKGYSSDAAGEYLVWYAGEYLVWYAGHGI
jgi:hypothetical protein